MAAPHYLLDTNIIFHWSASTPLGEHVRSFYGLDDPVVRPMVSIITHAECYARANFLGWGQDRLELLAEVLDSLLPVDVNQPEVFESYIDLYQIARKAGQNKDEKNQNDLWIASCAIANRATLITTDKDFAVFPDSTLPKCWIDPDAFSATP